MRGAVIVVSVASLTGGAGPARAEPSAGELRAERRAPDDGAPDDDDDGQLHLDTQLRLSIDDLDTRIERRERRFELGPARFALAGAWRESAVRVPVHGWRASASGSYDLGIARVVASAGVERVDTDLGSGTLITASVGVRRTFRLSPSVRGWIGLDLGLRRWRGAPPPGEASAAQLLLSIGLTY